MTIVDLFQIAGGILKTFDSTRWHDRSTRRRCRRAPKTLFFFPGDGDPSLLATTDYFFTEAELTIEEAYPRVLNIDIWRTLTHSCERYQHVEGYRKFLDFFRAGEDLTRPTARASLLAREDTGPARPWALPSVLPEPVV